MYDIMHLIEACGFDKVRDEQLELCRHARALLESNGFKNIAAHGFQAPGVMVSYADNATCTAARPSSRRASKPPPGVPLQCDEPADYRSFRIGLFGLAKLPNVERTVAHLKDTLEALGFGRTE